MLKEYIFHYNGDLANEKEVVAPGELTYHEHLVAENEKLCRANIEDRHGNSVEAYFDDGNELSVWVDELEEVK